MVDRVFVLGALVTLTAFATFAVRFDTATETDARVALDAALAERYGAVPVARDMGAVAG